MESHKLVHSFALAGLSWVLTGFAWLFTHIAVIAGAAAILASILSAMAAWETYRLRREERRQLNQARQDYVEPTRPWPRK